MEVFNNESCRSRKFETRHDFGANCHRRRFCSYTFGKYSFDGNNTYILNDGEVAVVKKDSAFTHDFDRVSKLAYKVFDELNDGTAAKETTAKLAAKILPMADNSASVNYLFDLSHMNTTLALHSERVAIFAGIIAKWMGFNWEEIRTIVTSAFLHDAGKKDFPQEMLGKTLQDLEGEQLQDYKRHCRKGYNILKNAGFEEPIPTIALMHHESERFERRKNSPLRQSCGSCRRLRQFDFGA